MLKQLLQEFVVMRFPKNFEFDAPEGEEIETSETIDGVEPDGENDGPTGDCDCDHCNKWREFIMQNAVGGDEAAAEYADDDDKDFNENPDDVDVDVDGEDVDLDFDFDEDEDEDESDEDESEDDSSEDESEDTLNNAGFKKN